MKQLLYQREAAVAYAEKWAYQRNPVYYNFDQVGGDCTNFASQCIYAGCGVMNHTPTYGWYYYSSSKRTASWTGVEYLYRFLTTNKSVGPYAEEVDISRMEQGDIVQLGDGNGYYYHSPVVVQVEKGIINPENILLAAHTYDVYGKPLSDYIYGQVRFLHLVGGRTW